MRTQHIRAIGHHTSFRCIIEPKDRMMSKKMSSGLLAMMIVTSTWIALIAVPTQAVDITFDVGTANEIDYSRFLTEVREIMTDDHFHYGGTHLPVMGEPKIQANYVLVDLENEGRTITIALSKNNMYVVGYLDKIGVLYRAFFFLDAPLNARTGLFPEARGANRVTLRYEGSYKKIEDNAGIKISSVGLGISTLKKLINQVYGAKVVRNQQATFFLVVIQMVSEAARFKYVENMVLENFHGFYRPDPKALELEVSWKKISKSIKNSTNGVFSTNLRLLDPYGGVWIVSRVNDIVSDMGLLLNVEIDDYKFIVDNYGSGDDAKLF